MPALAAGGKGKAIEFQLLYGSCFRAAASIWAIESRLKLPGSTMLKRGTRPGKTPGGGPAAVTD
jgi:hypothetical protein